VHAAGGLVSEIKWHCFPSLSLLCLLDEAIQHVMPVVGQQGPGLLEMQNCLLPAVAPVVGLAQAVTVVAIVRVKCHCFVQGCYSGLILQKYGMAGMHARRLDPTA